MSSTLGLMDLAFVILERDANPAHICGLALLSPEEGEAHHYAEALVNKLRASQPGRAPFNQLLDIGISHLPRWQPVAFVDMDYHVRHSHLPLPGDRHQLLELIARIHSYRLDRTRPLWELWVIDGLADNQVALLIKIHHACADGIKAVNMFSQCCSSDPLAPSPLFWDLPEAQLNGCDQQRNQALLPLIRRQFGASLGLTKIASQLLLNWAKVGTSRLSLPFTAPRTPFNRSRDKARTVALTSVPLRRLHRLAKLNGCSLNDVVLTVTDMALHRYLSQHNWRSERPMVAQMPINLRADGDELSGCNKFTLGMIELGRNDEPPLQRLHGISAATYATKQQALELSPDAYYQYAIIINGISVLAGRLDLDQWLPPATNMLISNVRGPNEQVYFNGARLDSLYPISLLVPGQSLNITLLSYNGKLQFGLTCCRRSLPGFEAVAEYLQQAVVELEHETLQALTSVLFEAAESA
ncbi:wax ester/triacylglycerol synthase family O-acyltransferase [Ferrimonas senticii]|uniref:wax ester/triacylglycerol synthase family O-acyltransferase n=1 Tax=Ferrimonas senticii TaxID=394566 RepID=UPI0004169E04|nr:wax ester/triacylglycerol synthase family O-acyltransferase [Ferrimonas senticii]